MQRKPRLKFFLRLFGISLILVVPTILALDALVFNRDLDVDFALWVVAGSMVSSVAVVWFTLRDLADVANYTQQAHQINKDNPELPALRSGIIRDLADDFAGLNRSWRRQIESFSRSLDNDVQILETLPDPLILINAAKKIIRANAAARILFGSAIEGAIEKTLRPAALLQATEAALRGERTEIVDIEWPDNPVRFFEARITSLKADGLDSVPDDIVQPHNSIAVVITLHEITDIKRAASLRERFIANVSHELRTPLSSLTGFIETLQGSARNDEDAKDRFLKIMQAQASRMARIINDLLHLSQLEQDKDTPRTNLDLGNLIHDVVNALELKIQQRGLKIALDIEDDLPQIQGDADQLFQVFQNLLDNAIKYGRDHTILTITINQKEQHGTILVSIKDEGEGVAAEHIPHLGERFYRVDVARSRSSGGSGLGLAIAFQIIRRHRGAIAIESTLGQGSTFYVSLPVAPT